MTPSTRRFRLPAGGFGRTRSLRLALALSALALLLAACPEDEATVEDQPEGDADPDAADEELTEIDVAFVPATTGVLLNVAEEEGFFEAHGLDATLSDADNISEVIPTLGQQFDISLGTSTDLIRAQETGLDIVQISGNTISTEDNPFAQLIVAEDSGIEDVTDLEGQRMGSPTPPGVINQAVLYWAQQEGADPDAIEVVQVPPPNHPDQLEAGQIDASQALEPFASQLQAAGHTSLGSPFEAIGEPLATNFWIAEGQWAEDNAEVVESFRDALADAQDFIEDEEGEARAREILQDYTGMPPEVAEDVPLPTFDLEVRTDDLDRWVEVLDELGEIDAEALDAEDMVH